MKGTGVILSKRGGIATFTVAIAALIAAGCGGSSGASDAVANSKALDFIPKSAIGYVTIDTDFDGEGWKQFNDLATAFDADYKPIEDQVADMQSEDESAKIDFAKDVEPWLGASAGAAILGVPSGDKDPEVVGWAEIEDRAALEKFLKKDGFTKGASAGDFTLWNEKDDETIVAVGDELAFISDSKKIVAATAKFSGDSISDADGVSELTDEVDGDSLAALVISGDGLRAAVKKSGEADALEALPMLKDLDGIAASFAAEDKGLRLHTIAKGQDLSTENGSTDLFQSLPENTLFALGGQDLGGTIDKALTSAGKENAQVQQGVGAISGAIGVDIDDLAKAFSGEYAIALSGEDAALQGLIGTAAGAAMGGGLGNIDPSALTKAGALTVAFENGDTTTETLDKVFGAVGSLTGGTAPVTGTSGDFETKSLNVMGVPVTAASSDDVSAVSVGTDVFETWGDTKLSDNDAFSDAWKAADAPDDVNMSLWLDWPRVSKIAGVTGGEDATAGGWVGYGEADGDSVSFDVFMHVETK